MAGRWPSQGIRRFHRPVSPRVVPPCGRGGRRLEIASAVRFHLLDKIEAVSDEQIIALKAVSQAEEYLADHFPTFPVLPGVLMLEAATQAAAWLGFRRTQFQGSVAVLRAARNVRYGNFVSPGNTLRITATYEKEVARGHAFQIEGTVLGASPGAAAITGKLELAFFRLQPP